MHACDCPAYFLHPYPRIPLLGNGANHGGLGHSASNNGIKTNPHRLTRSRHFPTENPFLGDSRLCQVDNQSNKAQSAFLENIEERSRVVSMFRTEGKLSIIKCDHLLFLSAGPNF